MERPSIENPEEYVKRHMAIEEEVPEKRNPNLFKKVFEYSLELSGKVDIKVGDLNLFFEYKSIEPSPDIDEQEVAEILKAKKDIKPEERHSILIKGLSKKIGLDKAEVREITEFKISNNSEVWNFNEELKDGKIFIFSGGEFPIGRYDPITKNIYINSPKSALDIITLLHESGHLVTFDNVVKNEERNDALLESKLNLDKKLLSAESYAVVLDLERTAWAYALRKISPFTKDLGITHQDVRGFISYGLDTYKKEFGICVIDDQISLKDTNENL